MREYERAHRTYVSPAAISLGSQVDLLEVGIFEVCNPRVMVFNKTIRNRYYCGFCLLINQWTIRPNAPIDASPA